MDLQPDPQNRPGPARIGDWMREEIEIRLPRAWLVAGSALFIALLIIALD